MIAGLEEITSGTISIGDRVVNDVPPEGPRHRDGVPELRALPAHDVRENLEFGLKLRKTPAAGDRPAGRPRPPGSSGIEELLARQARRSSPAASGSAWPLGRAIVRKPAVFLFDEPLSNLDAKLRVQMRAEITKLQQRLQATTIYVTHDQVEAMTMGHRIAVLHDGKLQQVGTPLDVYERPAEPLRGELHRHPADELHPRPPWSTGAPRCGRGLLAARRRRRPATPSPPGRQDRRRRHPPRARGGAPAYHPRRHGPVSSSPPSSRRPSATRSWSTAGRARTPSPSRWTRIARRRWAPRSRRSSRSTGSTSSTPRPRSALD